MTVPRSAPSPEAIDRLAGLLWECPYLLADTGPGDAREWYEQAAAWLLPKIGLPAPRDGAALTPALVKALDWFAAVDANHQAAGRIGTVEALECIDRAEWDDAAASVLVQWLAAPHPETR